MSIEDTQLLIARARNEADNVAFKVGPMALKLEA